MVYVTILAFFYMWINNPTHVQLKYTIIAGKCTHIVVSLCLDIEGMWHPMPHVNVQTQYLYHVSTNNSLTPHKILARHLSRALEKKDCINLRAHKMRKFNFQVLWTVYIMWERNILTIPSDFYLAKRMTHQISRNMSYLPNNALLQLRMWDWIGQYNSRSS